MYAVMLSEEDVYKGPINTNAPVACATLASK